MKFFYPSPISYDRYNVIRHKFGHNLANVITHYEEGHSDFCDHPHYVSLKNECFTVNRLNWDICASYRD